MPFIKKVAIVYSRVRKQQTKGKNDMATFTKKYSVEPNKAQKAALTGVFKNQTLFEMSQGKDVEIILNKFHGTLLLATLMIAGRIFESRVIGPRGGVTMLESAL